MLKGDKSYMVQARERFSASQAGWKCVREDYRADVRLVSGDPAQQWDPQVKQSRDDDHIPALTFDRIHPDVEKIVNKASKDRNQPKVVPGDGGNKEMADIYEGKMRHLQYASQAEMAYDNAILCSTSGGVGYYRICLDYTSKNGTDQEPTLERILDPLTVYFDPNVQMPHYADAEYCFIRKQYLRDAFKREFGVEPISFPFEDRDLKEWGDEKNVWVAEYIWVEKKTRTKLFLWDGSAVYKDEVEDVPPEFIINQRDIEDRIIHCDIIDGAKALEEKIWPGEWIPIIPVTAPEMVSEGQRRYISAVRYKRDPQMLLNANVSTAAFILGSADHSEFIGYKGQFKDIKWRDGKRHKYLEVEPTMINGQPAPLPQRGNYDPHIDTYMQAMLIAADGVKGSSGYVDNVARPSQADISGVAVDRRDAQANLSNLQFEKYLAWSQWHGGRVMLDLLIKTTDTPRVWQVRKEDGTQSTIPVVPHSMRDEQGTYPAVRGMEDQDPYPIGDGDYGLEVRVGPGYASKLEEEVDVLLDFLKANPAAWQFFGDLVFKKLGYTDLEERAKLMLPPPIQEAIAGEAKGIPPVAQAQIAMLKAQNEQMKAALQEVLQKLQTKQIETQGKLDLSKLEFIQDMILQSLDFKHDAAKIEMQGRVGAAKHMLDLVKEFELAPDPVKTPAYSKKPN